MNFSYQRIKHILIRITIKSYLDLEFEIKWITFISRLAFTKSSMRKLPPLILIAWVALSMQRFVNARYSFAQVTEQESDDVKGKKIIISYSCILF